MRKKIEEFTWVTAAFMIKGRFLKNIRGTNSTLHSPVHPNGGIGRFFGEVDNFQICQNG